MSLLRVTKKMLLNDAFPKTIISKFFPGRRVPVLIPIKNTINGPRALPLNPDVAKEELAFLNVFQRLAMESFLLPEELKEKFKGVVPYDAYFPSIQDKVESRICKSCLKYFSLKLSLKEDKQICKKKRSKDDNGGQQDLEGLQCGLGVQPL